MAASGLISRNDLVGFGRAISVFFGVDGVRKKRSHLVGPPFPAFKARFQLRQVGISWDLTRCLLIGGCGQSHVFVKDSWNDLWEQFEPNNSTEQKLFKISREWKWPWEVNSDPKELRMNPGNEIRWHTLWYWTYHNFGVSPMTLNGAENIRLVLYSHTIYSMYWVLCSTGTLTSYNVVTCSVRKMISYYMYLHSSSTAYDQVHALQTLSVAL